MPIPNEAERKKLKWLLERLSASEEFCRPYFERAKRYYRLYRFGSAVDEADWPYVNRVRSKDILAFVEDSTAILIQTLFAVTPFFSVIPRETRVLYSQHEGIDAFAIGDQISRLIDYTVSHEDTEFFTEMIDYFKGGTMLGNSYEGVYPKFDSRGEYLRPLLKTHDFWDVMPITGAIRVSKALGMFVREFTSLEQLQTAKINGQPVYRNLDQLNGPGSSETDPSIEWHKSLLQEVGMSNYEVDNDNIEVINYISGGHVITFANRKVILRDSNEDAQGQIIQAQQMGVQVTPDQIKNLQPYPYDMPVVQYKYMSLPKEFFAMGIPEVLEVLAEDKNLIKSARRDNIDICINKILKVRQGTDNNLDLLKYYAGALWPLENLNDVEQLEQGDVTQSSYQEEQMRTGDMENALSLFGYARGMTPEHSERPTTVARLQQASLNRLDLAVKLAEFGPLQQIATRIVLLARRFMSPGTYEAIVGDYDAGFYKLSEEDIRRFYHFKPVGSSVTHVKEVRQQQIQAASQYLQALNPQMTAMNIQPFTVDMYEASKTALEALEIRNADRILVKIQQPQQPGMEGMMGGQGGQGMPQGQEMQQLAQQLSQVPYGGQQ